MAAEWPEFASSSRKTNVGSSENEKKVCYATFLEVAIFTPDILFEMRVRKCLCVSGLLRSTISRR